MKDLLLLAAVTVIFIIGWILVKKLDCFLEEYDQSVVSLSEKEKTNETIKAGSRSADAWN